MEVAMRPSTPIPENRLTELKDFRKSKWPGLEFQRFLCVWLRVEQGLANKEIANVLGWNVNTVRITQRDFIAHGPKTFLEEKRGGRRRQLMTLEEEKFFLAAFAGIAGDGALLVISEIKIALEEQLGHKVHKTTVYRLLRRHGWRKIVPRPKHPKQDKEAVDAFKKGASPIK
jgi:transposase